MVRLRLLKKITILTLVFFTWFLFTANFNFAQEVGESYLGKAKKLYDKGEYDDALELLNKFVKRYKKKSEKKKEVAEAYYFMAKIYYDIGKTDNEIDKSLDGIPEEYRPKISKYLKKVFSIDQEFYIGETDSTFREIVDKIKKIIEKPGPPKKRKKKFPVLILVAGVAVVVATILLLGKKSKEPKKYNLTVERGEGVDGVPASGTYEYNEGTNVNYSYSL